LLPPRWPPEQLVRLLLDLHFLLPLLLGRARRPSHEGLRATARAMIMFQCGQMSAAEGGGGGGRRKCACVPVGGGGRRLGQCQW
jgi:hypothetical protein